MAQTAFTSGPLTTGTTADDGGGGVAWANVSNAKVEDGAVASCASIGPGGGGGVPNQLKATNYGFAIPTNAIIDGIKLEAKVQTTGGLAGVDTGRVNLVYNGGSTNATNTPNIGQSWPTPALAWLTYGGSTSLWGRSWTAAEINHANFGAALAAFPASGTATLNIDSVRITVYWHYSVDVSPADVPKRHLYKVFNKGYYLGNLPKVTTPFGYSLDINSAGAAINIECGVSLDTSSLPGSRLVTEAGDPITTESGEYIYTDGQPSLISAGNSVDATIIQNGNRIEVWEYSYYYPNGKLMFRGQVNRIDAGFGDGVDNKIKLLVISDGLDLNNYIARGAPFAYTADVTQTAQNLYAYVTESGDKGGGWQRYGQTWVVGAGVTKLGAITLMLNGTADVTITAYDNLGSSTPLGSITQAVSTGGIPTVLQFGLASLVGVVAGGTYFFTISVGAGQVIAVYYSNANSYANGGMYGSNYAGGSGGGSYTPVANGDLYFIASAGVGTTTATYTSKDPSTQMLKPIIDDYRLRGGLLNYATDSVDATGLSLTVTFNTETILDAIKKCLSVSPSGFYFYADLGSDIIYFKNTLATPTYKLIKGRHLNKVNLVMSIENVKNDLLFSGAEVAGTNLYTEYTSQASQTNYGKRLERKSDNRVSVQATADAIGSSFIAENKDEYYETTVTVVDTTMDITLFKPGQTIGLRGFGTFIDRLTLQIVRVEYSPKSVNLTIGNLPKRFSNEFEKIIRGLTAQQTVANPSAPS